MKRILVPIFCLLSVWSFSQSSVKFPHYTNSISLESAAPAIYVVDLIQWHRAPIDYKIVHFPATFINYECKIKNKFYAVAAFSYGENIHGLWLSTDTFGFSYHQWNCYVGILFKQKILKNLYFTPSFDFYYTKQKSWSKDSLIRNVNYYGIGPTIGIEYYFSNRFSMNADIVSIAFGNISGMFQKLSGRESLIATNGEYPRYQFWIYKEFSLGMHYNFDWKRKQK